MRLSFAGPHIKILILILLVSITSACSSAAPEVTASSIPPFVATHTNTATRTHTPEPSPSVTLTATPSRTPTPTLTPSPSVTPTPTRLPIFPANAASLEQIDRIGNGTIEDIAWWPDADTLAVITRAGILLYDASTYEELRFIEPPLQSSLYSAALSPNGKMIASSGQNDNTIKLWDIESGQITHLLENSQNSHVYSLAFSPNGDLLASGTFGSLLVWDVAAGELKYTLTGLSDPAIFKVLFTPDGSRLVAVSCGMQYCSGLGIWNVEERRMLRALSMPRSRSANAALSADGSLLAVGGDQEVFVYEIDTGLLRTKIQVSASHFTSLAFTHDGKRLVTGGYWGQPLNVWSTSTGGLTRSISANGTQFLLIHPDGERLFSAGGEIEVWELNSEEKLANITGFGSSALALRPDGKALIAGPDGWQVWDFDEGKPQSDPFGGKYLSTSPNGSLTAMQGYRPESNSYYIHLWDARSAKPLNILEGDLGRIESSGFSPDARQFAAVVYASGNWEDGVVHVWNTETGKVLYTIPHRELNSMSFSPDGSLLVTGGSKTIKVIEPSSGEVIKELYQSSQIRHITFNADGRLLATTGWGEVQVWDMTTLQQKFMRSGGGGNAAFSPDSSIVAVFGGVHVSGRGYQRFLRLWNALDGELLHDINGEITDFIGEGNIQFSQDGQAVVVTGLIENTARIIDVNTGDILADLPLPYGCEPFHITLDERYMAFSCSDGTVRVYAARR